MKKLTEKERISHQNKVNEEDLNLQANVKRESSKNDIDRQELVVSGAPSKKRGQIWKIQKIKWKNYDFRINHGSVN